jgi:splicing factor 3A subunit 1
MKLTALFTAQRGRNFLAALSAREGNYQFDFLRPTHSLFGYFNWLVDQYTKVLHPSKAMLDQLKEFSQDGSRWKMLDEAQGHATWQRIKQEKDKKRQDDQEAERSECSVWSCCSLMFICSPSLFSRICRD